MTLIAPGTCRHCGCHGENCSMPDGDRCWFTDRERTVCSAPACQRAEAWRRKEYLRRNRAEQQKRETERRAKRQARKGRAA